MTLLSHSSAVWHRQLTEFSFTDTCCRSGSLAVIVRGKKAGRRPADIRRVSPRMPANERIVYYGAISPIGLWASASLPRAPLPPTSQYHSVLGLVRSILSEPRSP